MSKPTPLSGFPELLPAARVVERELIASLSHTFELHGFGGIETRAVEPMDQLLRKGETSKEVYLLRRLQATTDEPEGEDTLGLHFDLTVPFAALPRYVEQIRAGEDLTRPTERLAAERVAARTASHPAAARCHQALADSYELLIRCGSSR